ncbi:glutathione S-transferase [Limtongia smithiae]|uniref:glutathione S-transferase n=1 Tax=Limtongia smithiae TaxID=1125753 RepID=UPI0034CFB5FA
MESTYEPATEAPAPTPAPTLVLHWLEQSRSHRILWLLEELHLPYTLKVYKRDPRTFLADPALKQVHPRGKSPVLEDNGMIIAESGLIIEYLISKYGKDMKPKTEGEEMKVKYYLHYAEGSLMPIMLLLFVTNNIRSAKVPFFIRPIARTIANKTDDAFAGPDATSQLEFLESQLANSSTGYFVGGSLSGADIILIYPLQVAVLRAGLTQEKYPLLYRWLEAMQAREAYKRADEVVAEQGFGSIVKL